MEDSGFRYAPILRRALILMTAAGMGLIIMAAPSLLAGIALAAGATGLGALSLLARQVLTLRDNQGDLQQIQNHLNSGMNLLSDRLADHDLMLMDLADRMDQIQTRMGTMETLGTRQRRKDKEFMVALAGKMMTLAKMVNRPEKKAQESPKTKQKPTQAQIGTRTLRPAANDEDWTVSPSLIHDGLRQAIETHRIDLYIQPIARLPGRTIFGYEIYGRIRVQPGLYAPAHLYRPLAESQGRISEIDTLVVDELIQNVKKAPLPRGHIFLNLSAHSLTNARIVAKLGRLGHDLKRNGTTLVLEIAQEDLAGIRAGQARILSELHHLGLEYSLDDVKSPRISLADLKEVGFSYLKLPVATLLAGATMDKTWGALDRFLIRAQSCGLTIIAGRIEDQKDLIALTDYPVTLGQGHLLGRPDRPVAYPEFCRTAA